MPITVELIGVPPGITSPVLKLFPEGSDTIANGAGGDALTYATNRKGYVSATVAEDLSGRHTAHVEDSGGNLVFTEVLVLGGDSTIARNFDVSKLVSVQTLLDYDNAIWVDPTNGTDGSVFGDDGYGKRSAPCKTWANVNSLLGTSGFCRVRVIGSGTLTINAAITSFVLSFELDSTATLAFGASASTATSSKISVRGGAVSLNSLDIGFRAKLHIDYSDVSGAPSASSGPDAGIYLNRCDIIGTLTLQGGVSIFSAGSCTGIYQNDVNITTTGATAHCRFADWLGYMTLNPGGADVDCSGQSASLNINGTSGSVTLIGEIKYTDGSGGLVAIDSTGITAKEATLGTPADTDMSTDIANLQAEFDAGVNVATVELTDATDYFTAMITTILAKIQRWFSLIARSDAAAKADLSTEFNELNANFGTGVGTYDNELKALQASGNITSLGGSAQALTNLKNSSLAILSGEVATADSTANSETSFDTNLPQETENYYGDGSGGLVVAFVSGTTNAFQTRRIVASVNSGASNTRITLEQALDDVPADTDAFVLLGRITELN